MFLFLEMKTPNTFVGMLGFLKTLRNNTSTFLKMNHFQEMFSVIAFGNMIQHIFSGLFTFLICKSILRFSFYFTKK